MQTSVLLLLILGTKTRPVLQYVTAKAKQTKQSAKPERSQKRQPSEFECPFCTFYSYTILSTTVLAILPWGLKEGEKPPGLLSKVQPVWLPHNQNSLTIWGHFRNSHITLLTSRHSRQSRLFVVPCSLHRSVRSRFNEWTMWNDTSTNPHRSQQSFDNQSIDWLIDCQKKNEGSNLTWRQLLLPSWQLSHCSQQLQWLWPWGFEGNRLWNPPVQVSAMFSVMAHFCALCECHCVCIPSSDASSLPEMH